nr:MAG TPA: hypothetical protein [Crassvirales sp.]
MTNFITASSNHNLPPPLIIYKFIHKFIVLKIKLLQLVVQL